jgi:hypothetical protein
MDFRRLVDRTIRSDRAIRTHPQTTVIVVSFELGVVVIVGAIATTRKAHDEDVVPHHTPVSKPPPPPMATGTLEIRSMIE